MAEPSDGVPEPDNRLKEQPLELRSQADLIIREFERLQDYDFDSPTDTLIDISIGRLRSKKDLLTRLDSSLLPQLQQQCTSLSGLLRRPNHLKNNPASMFKQISQIQANLRLTFSQIVQTLNEVFPGKIPEPCQRNDQHFKELKIYRLHRFNDSLRGNIPNRLQLLFEDSITFIDNFKLSTARRSDENEFAYLKIDEEIQLTIRYLKGSELSLIWELWKDLIKMSHYELEYLLDQMDPIRPLNQERKSLLSQPSIQLGRSILPIFKLSRLFFKKLYRQNVNKEGTELFTEMCSNQLFFLHKSMDKIRDEISDLLAYVLDANRPAPGATSSAIIQALKELIKLFQSYLSPINLYVLPNMFPNRTDLSRQTDLRDWFVTWTTSFLVASHNAIQAAELFAET
ncbi:hypothetical protein PGT21_016805 [Puccinia graminis f. sp. tritici]|uniref:Uncharacterized protein n=2 Tax=Puccinia graminis f. sp. tritici TaxID=56615 RepID=A0A5B0MBE4_PUCGR|nr:hypothetical protein PGT21_016805 [Puccinia graminis f. sp. tritici]